MQIVALIPAYNPSPQLVELAGELSRLDFARIIVVDDGSSASSSAIFARLDELPGCQVLRHAVNLGKGRALKTGFNHCLLDVPDLAGVVTVDADGQHLAEDVRKVAAAFLADPRALVIGARTFSAGVPLRSRFGNLLTRRIFRLLVGGRLTDTQSGLRGIPAALLPALISLDGERYEYEMNMLIHAHKRRVVMSEVPIATVYLDNNRSSHFNPLLDSMKIYFLLLRFSFSSLFAGSIDFILFSLVYLLRGDILSAMVVARLVSGGVNFTVNRSLVFHDREHPLRPFFKYLLLFIALAVLSYLSIRALAAAGVNVILAKILVESLLFLASFTIQRDFIFLGQAGPVAER